ncbi:MAG: class II fumarate hydratase [Vicinamibacteraceae bacterium]|nr:class II fumarate hydratase [Vicinamibacteraceae bacterium]
MRREHDALGEVAVPAERLWGAQTQRSIENFPIGGGRYRMPLAVVHALGRVKAAAALANLELGALDEPRARAIAAAADEVAEGRWDDEFPLVVFQTGSGTQSNMNANEVIARRAMQWAGEHGGPALDIHPNDHVNRSQSSNDVFPTAMHVAARLEIDARLVPAVRGLRATLASKAEAHAGLVMMGRTHLQDATPVTLGQVISGWVAQLDEALARLAAAVRELEALAIGGTAVGTGLNAPAGFGDAVARRLADRTGVPFRVAGNLFAALSAHDAMVHVSAALRGVAVAATKIANDVRWYASGPRSGIGELVLPANEPGSSIMPGKINPTQAEALTMVCAQVMGNDHAVAIAGMQGHFQLNTFKPVIVHNVLESAALLADALASFEARAAAGLEPNTARIARHVNESLMLVTALTPHIGYERAAAIALAADREGLTLRESALTVGGLTAEEFDAWVRPADMVGDPDSPSGATNSK